MPWSRFAIFVIPLFLSKFFSGTGREPHRCTFLISAPTHMVGRCKLYLAALGKESMYSDLVAGLKPNVFDEASKVCFLCLQSWLLSNKFGVFFLKKKKKKKKKKKDESRKEKQVQNM